MYGPKSSRGKYPVRERPHVPTFVPTLIPAAFVPLHFRHKVDTRLPNWLGGCDQANLGRQGRGEPCTCERGRGEVKSEKDVFRSEIVCWLSTSSLTSQRGRRAAKRQRGRVRCAFPAAHLRAILLLAATASGNTFPYTFRHSWSDFGNIFECTNINMRNVQVFTYLRPKSISTILSTFERNFATVFVIPTN